MAGALSTLSRERWTMLAILALAALACLLGAVDRVPLAGSHGTAGEALDLIRVLSTTTLAIALLLGPGLLWRALAEREIGLGYLALPGLGLLAASGGLAWLRA